VYDVPFVSPVTIIDDDEPDAVIPSGSDVTVYPVMTEPPLFIGAVNDTVACVFPATADTEVGESGTVAGIGGAVGKGNGEIPNVPPKLTVSPPPNRPLKYSVCTPEVYVFCLEEFPSVF
jgi:hypothetical protein